MTPAVHGPLFIEEEREKAGKLGLLPLPYGGAEGRTVWQAVHSAHLQDQS